MTSASNLRIDPDRLWASIEETAQCGATPRGGLKRLALSEEDRQVREWFARACAALGGTVTVDAMGNQFARRPGRDETLAPVAIGSHLDTQPTGGRYDGVIGVLAGLEVLRTLHDAGYETAAPIEVANWTNEEGSRFAPAMLASGVFAGVFAQAWAEAREDRDGARFGDALDRIGARGTVPCGGRALSAHFELHIEQGPVLEAEGRVIGVVTGVQAMRWYEVEITGRESHAGTTPMPLRRDALAAAADVVRAVEALGRAHAPDAVATVGLLECRPNSRNVVPGSAFVTVDLRHPSDAVLAAMETGLEAILDKLRAERQVGVALSQVWDSPAVRFDPACVDAVRRAAEAAGQTAREIVSGAGHDSAYIARVAPTAMIFIPCRDGLSHNEAEHAERDHVAAGAEVLLRAVLETDRRIAEGAGERR